MIKIWSILNVNSCFSFFSRASLPESTNTVASLAVSGANVVDGRHALGSTGLLEAGSAAAAACQLEPADFGFSDSPGVQMVRDSVRFMFKNAFDRVLNSEVDLEAQQS